jgi:hypothetical protein
MNRTPALLAVCFCAGLIGAFINSLVVWLSGLWGLTAMAGVAIAPDLTPSWLCARLIWGGLWGLVFFLAVAPPRRRRHWVRKGLWVSLLPTAAQLFFFFPHQTPYGLMGFELGNLTPLLVFFFNLVWGFATGIFTRLLWGRG